LLFPNPFHIFPANITISLNRLSGIPTPNYINKLNIKQLK